MTKKVKSSRQKYQPAIYELPFLGIGYGFFPDRETFDKVLKENGIPLYKFDTDEITYAATIRGHHTTGHSYAFVYAEPMLNDEDIDETKRLGYLAHEAYHVVCFMFECMGEVKPSEEAFAYTLGKVCTNLFNEYFKWKESVSG